MIPLGLMELADPVPGHLFAERVEMPHTHGRIILPHASREMKRALEAVVRVSLVDGYEEGDQIILAPSVARSITFGFGEESVTWWIVTREQVVARLVEEGDKIERGLEHPLSHQTSERLEQLHDDRLEFDEGDSYGPI